MKKLLLFLMLTTSICKAQVEHRTDALDSLNQRLQKIQWKIDSYGISIESLENKQNKIDLNLSKCHKQYIVGTTVLTFGLIGSVIAAGLYNSATNKKDEKSKEDGQKMAISIYSIASLLTFTGIVIQIDSHRFLGRGSRDRTPKNSDNW